MAQGHELLLGVTKQARRASSGFPLATWGGVESLASPEQRGREPLSGTRHKPERLFALAGTPALALRSGTAGRALGVSVSRERQGEDCARPVAPSRGGGAPDRR